MLRLLKCAAEWACPPLIKKVESQGEPFGQPSPRSRLARGGRPCRHLCMWGRYPRGEEAVSGPLAGHGGWVCPVGEVPFQEQTVGALLTPHRVRWGTPFQGHSGNPT